MSFTLVQVIVGGLLLGAVYALFSSGLTLIWGMMNVINFAHGDFVMLGMYVAFVVWSVFGVGPAAAVPAAALLLATLGVVCYFGANFRSLPENLVGGTLEIGAIRIESSRLLAGVVALLVTAGLHLML